MCDRCVTYQCVVIVSCGPCAGSVSCRVHSYSYVLVRVCIHAVVLIGLRYVTLGSYVRYVFGSCVRYVFVRVHTA